VFPFVCPFVIPRFDTELAAEIKEESLGEVYMIDVGGFTDSSCPTHQSHSNHPKNVAMLPHPTTATGETRLCSISTKQTTKIMTEQTCWTMTVESATSGQKSYG
jgi:hypothetical protein